jgi:hypothetical protein
MAIVWSYKLAKVDRLAAVHINDGILRSWTVLTHLVELSICFYEIKINIR